MKNAVSEKVKTMISQYKRSRGDVKSIPLFGKAGRNSTLDPRLLNHYNAAVKVAGEKSEEIKTDHGSLAPVLSAHGLQSLAITTKIALAGKFLEFLKESDLNTTTKILTETLSNWAKGERTTK